MKLVQLAHAGSLQRPRANRYWSRTGSRCRAHAGLLAEVEHHLKQFHNVTIARFWYSVPTG